MKGFILALASGAYVGYFPWAPGTAGTLLALGIYLGFSRFPPWLYLCTVIGVFFLAWWAAGRAERILGKKDSPKIVIDEIVGYLIAMAFLSPTVTAILGGFLFFRILDIIKPPPAGAIDRRMGGGMAVVLDDAVVGLYVNFLLRAIFYWRPHLLHLADPWLGGLS